MLIGIHNTGRLRRCIAWQMVVSDQHLYTQGIGLGNAFYTGNAIIYRDNQIRTARSGKRDDLRS